MGKRKKIRSKRTSNGERKNIATKHKFDLYSPAERALFKLEAKSAGKRTCETIPNPDKSNTKERFIRVCTNGR